MWWAPQPSVAELSQEPGFPNGAGVSSQAPLPWPEGVSALQGMVFAVFPRSLQGGEMYQEGPGHSPATLPHICPGPGLCPLTAGNDMLDPSMAAPESWLMSLALASSKEVSFQTGQLVRGHGLDLMMRPADAAVAVSITALSEPSSTGGSIPDRPCSSAQGTTATWVSFEGAWEGSAVSTF